MAGLNDIAEAKLKKLELLKAKKKLQDELPHLYGWSWYPWAWEFFSNCKDKIQILCAANQISKSSTQIRKCIDWATDMKKWDKLWGRQPNLFWYLYPTQAVATIEFEKKWVPEFMPSGAMKSHPVYGWRAVYSKKEIDCVHFNSGVSIYFKAYSQSATALQTGSVYSIFCDEELPENIYDELQFRTAATNGYFHMVFTATLGQEMWWRAMECVGQGQEFLKDAWKKSVSMYECLKYKDGSDSPWTVEKIKEIEQKCKSNAEIQRRVHGRFVKEDGRKFHAFDPKRHYVEPFTIDKSYHWYVGVDVGSGGETGHPSAIVFVAVARNFQKGYIVRTWRGDGIPTTAGDVYEKYKEMSSDIMPVRSVYDFAAKDFGTIASRLGESFNKAEKSHELGEQIINTLFKNDMLLIFDSDENRKLGVELLNLQSSTPKNKAKDDLADASRYAIVEIPWDFSAIKAKTASIVEEVKPSMPRNEKEWQAYHIEERRKLFQDPRDLSQEDGWGVEDEIAMWNEEYGN